MNFPRKGRVRRRMWTRFNYILFLFEGKETLNQSNYFVPNEIVTVWR